MDNKYEYEDEYEYEKRSRRDSKRASEKKPAPVEDDDYYDDTGMVIPPALFWCIIAITAIMLVVVIFLGVKLIKSSNTAAEAEAAIVQLDKYETENTELADKLSSAQDEYDALKADYDSYKQATDAKIAELEAGGTTAPETKPETETGTETKPETKEEDYWLDLSGHSEIKVRPENLLSEYKTYYVKGSTVNVRAGDSTSQKALFTVKKGAKVQVAAIDGDWAFVKSGDNYGWIKLEYLSLNVVKTATTTTTKKKEATSGNLN